MASVIAMLEDAGKIPLTHESIYEVMMGSHAYGTHDENSDHDIYGICIPPLEDILVGRKGILYHFDPQPSIFEEVQQQGIEHGSKHYDIFHYNITKFFRMALENNPNIVDALFVPENCVLHINSIGQMIRDNRKLFLHKGCWIKFKGYAYSQLKRAKDKKPEGKRVEMYKQFGYDPKAAYHLVRLIYEVEDLLKEGDMDLTKNREKLKEIKYGRVDFEYVEQLFRDKERHLEQIYESSAVLPAVPNRDDVRALLIACIEAYHKRSISNVELKVANYRAEKTIKDIENLLVQYRTRTPR